MRIFSRETKSDQQHRRAKYLLEISDDGDRSALARDHGLLPERRAQCPPRSIVDRTIELGAPRMSAVQSVDAHLHTLGRNLHHVRFYQLLDVGRSLIGNETAADLRHGFRGEHRLCAFAGVAAQEPVHLARRTNPQLLECGVSFLPAECVDASLLHESLVVERQRAHLLPDLRIPFAHFLVESGNRNASVFVVEGREDACERHRRIHDRAAVASRVKIARRSLDSDLEVGETAQ